MTKKTPTKQDALTLRSNGGILSALISDILVMPPYIGQPQSAGANQCAIKGIWDTGASNSVITKDVADKLGLKPIGKVNVNTAGGTMIANVYLINVILPCNVTIEGVRATEGILKDFDMLIGMDIITLGDFSITNMNGKTVMSFRLPSCHEIDYVRAIRREQNYGQYLPKPKKPKKKKK